MHYDLSIPENLFYIKQLILKTTTFKNYFEGLTPITPLTPYNFVRFAHSCN